MFCDSYSFESYRIRGLLHDLQQVWELSSIQKREETWGEFLVTNTSY